MLNVAYIVADRNDDIFELSVRQVLNLADRFVFVIDRPDENTWKVIELAQECKETIILHHKYLHESKNADGLQRSVYLDWLKNNAVGEWCLVLDTDEVISDNWHELIKYTNHEVLSCFDLRMRHLWYSLAFEDNTSETHRVPLRFFKVSKGLSYPLVEHPVLKGYNEGGVILDVQVWHFNVVKGLLNELKKYKVQCVKSNMHNSDALLNWHAMHLLGTCPLKRIDLKELPRIVKEHFLLNNEGIPVLYSLVKQ